MDEINLAWLLAGLGLGLGSSWLLRRDSLLSRRTPPRLRALQAEPEITSEVSNQAVSYPKDQQLLVDQLQRLQLAYQMASELSQFKGGFLARTSHELRSPLNGLIGMQQLILSDLCDSPEEEREFIAQANEAALRMVKALDNIIEVAKTEHGSAKLDIQPIQLAQALQDVYALTHLQAKNRNLQLQILPPSPETYVLADPRCLMQILVHLLDSAISNLQEGQITLSTHLAQNAKFMQVRIKDSRPLEVWSEAIDMLKAPPPQDLKVPSPGMNLLMVQTLLELMQGRLEIAKDPEDDQPLIQCSIPLVIPELE